DLAIALDAPHCLEVILVVDMRLGTRMDDGFVKREPHAVLLEKDAPAGPGFRADFVFGADDVFYIANNHAFLLIGCRTSARGRRGQPLPWGTRHRPQARRPRSGR